MSVTPGTRAAICLLVLLALAVVACSAEWPMSVTVVIVATPTQVAPQTIATAAPTSGTGDPGTVATPTQAAGPQSAATEVPTSETRDSDIVAAPTQATASPSSATVAPTSPAATQGGGAAAPIPSDPDFLLPDLQTLPPTDLVIELTESDQRLLRFSNSMLNSGPGTLELVGQFNPDSGEIAVTQHIYTSDGTFEEYATGEFIFHVGHDHWHFENFALYEVWSLTPAGDLDDVVALTDKVSYCIRDDARAEIPGAAVEPVYTVCDQDLQGIAVGWIDIYEFDTPGQIVDITPLPDGVYALQSTVDPADQIREADEANNAAVVYFEVRDDRVRIIDSDSISQLPTPET